MILMLHGFTGNKVEANRLFVDIASYYYIYIFGSFRTRVDALEDMGKYNAIELADEISIPMLIIHAKDDQVVPYTQSTEFFEKLKIQDKKLILLDEGGHVFSIYISKTRVITEIVN